MTLIHSNLSERNASAEKRILNFVTRNRKTELSTLPETSDFYFPIRTNQNTL